MPRKSKPDLQNGPAATATAAPPPAPRRRAKNAAPPPTRPAPAANGAATAQPAAAPERPMVYPTLTLKKHIGSTPLTVPLVVKYMGLRVEEEPGQFGDAYLFTDLNGKKVRCIHNLTNRPFYPSTCDALKQMVLRRQWRCNGEPMIIGCYGSVLDGQHTGAAVYLAEQERTGPDAEYWAQFWDGPVSIEKLVVLGISEDDETVNSLNTGRPRTLSDVIYRSVYFAHLSARDRKVLSSLTDHAIRFMWSRTGAGLNAFAGVRTHPQSQAFLARHPRLLEAVAHVRQEDGKDGKVRYYLTPGYASAVLYLMAVSATDPEEYQASREPGEAQLDMSRWDLACEFWARLAGSSPHFAEVHAVFVSLVNGGGGDRPERLTVLAKAWDLFVRGEPLTREGLWPRFFEQDDGTRRLEEYPAFGGIDLGDPEAAARLENLHDVLGDPDPSDPADPSHPDHDGEPYQEDPYTPDQPGEDEAVEYEHMNTAGSTWREPTPEEIRQRAAEQRARHLAEMQDPPEEEDGHGNPVRRRRARRQPTPEDVARKSRA